MGLTRAQIINAKNIAVAKVKNRYFISLAEAAKNNNISTFRMHGLIRMGRVKEAYKVGQSWIIPWKWRHVRRKAYNPRKKRKKTKEEMLDHRTWFKLKDPSIVDNDKVSK